jgi:8-oxo-dGTP pyrophosphatase MutT (NUDIX family)
VATVCTPLDRDPVLIEVGAPPFTPAMQQLVDSERAILEANPHGFDGPVAIALTVDGERIEVYRSTYSVYKAHCLTADEDGRSLFGLGCLGVCLLIRDSQGRTLWTQRGPHVDLPGTWQFGIAGGADWAETPRSAARREASEELGLQVQDLRPLGYCTGPEGIGVYIVFETVISADTPLQLNNEVATVRWVRDPLIELNPVHPLIVPVWESLRLAGRLDLLLAATLTFDEEEIDALSWAAGHKLEIYGGRPGFEALESGWLKLVHARGFSDAD